MEHQTRIEYRNRLVTLHKSIPGSKLSYESRFSHHVWPDLVLRDKKGNEIASVCTTGSVFLNHWFQGAA